LATWLSVYRIELPGVTGRRSSVTLCEGGCSGWLDSVTAPESTRCTFTPFNRKPL
jgi:hypothetical protein